MAGRLEWVKEGLQLACRILLSATFIWACLHKIADPYDFGLQIATYQILPLYLVNLQAIALPWVELISGMLLVVGFMTRPSALIICGMNIMFIVAISIALSENLHLQCGCFSSSDAGEQMNAGLLLRDIGLLAAGVFLVATEPGRLTVDRWIARRRSHA